MGVMLSRLGGASVQGPGKEVKPIGTHSEWGDREDLNKVRDRRRALRERRKDRFQ